MIFKIKRHIVFFVAVVAMLLPFSSISQTEEELKIKADALFKKEQYVEATPLYLRLLSLNPRDYNYNYRYGTCLLFNSDKKQDAFKYLNYAAKGEDVEIEVFYFVGKAYHLTFDFNKAIQFYKKYKQVAGSKASQSLNTDRQIEMAENGKKLLSHISDLIIESRKIINLSDFFRLYDLSNIGGTILVTEEFQTKLDKKNNHTPLIHFPANSDRIFYSSYGEDGKTEKDIYVRRKLPDGTWGMAQKLQGLVNTQYDEDFPYMHPNGQYLYFSSKGHNSMGGYDVFRAPYIEEDDIFGPPENLDFAISSPDDDLFYVVDSLDKNAFFASARQSQDGKIHVYKMRVQRSPDQMVIFKGNFISNINPSQKVISIEVNDVASGRKIGSYKSNKVDGGFLITLPKGGRYEYVLKVDGSADIHIAEINAPFLDELKPLKQRIIEYEDGGEIIVRVDNLFNEEFDDISDILAEVLKNKSQLTPNSDEFDLDALDQIENQKRILANLHLERYNVSELKDISISDVERLKREQIEIENELNKLLMVADNAMKEALKSDSIANLLLVEANNAETKKSANTKLDDALKEKYDAKKNVETATEALALYNELKNTKEKNSENLDKAKKVAAILETLTNDNLQEKLAELAKEDADYVKNNFNNNNAKLSPAQILYSKVDETSEIFQVSKKQNEVIQLKEAIRKREGEIKKLEEDKEFAKKKELDEIERKISTLVSDIEADKQLISLKEKEIRNDSTKENEILAKKSAIDQTRNITDEMIQSNLSVNSLNLKIQTIRNLSDNNEIANFEDKTNELRQDLASKTYQSESSSTELASTNSSQNNTDISSTNETVKNTDIVSKQNPTNQNVAKLNPTLKEKENKLLNSNLSEKESTKHRAEIEKEWVEELTNEIQRKEKELSNNPNNSKVKDEIALLKEEQAKKKELIAEYENIINSTSNDELAIENIIRSINPDYEKNKTKALNNSSETQKLKQLNNADKELIQALEERLDLMKNVNTADAAKESNLIKNKITDLNKEIEYRNNIIEIVKDDQELSETIAMTSSDKTLTEFGGSKTIQSLSTEIDNLKTNQNSSANTTQLITKEKELLSEANLRLYQIESELSNKPNDQLLLQQKDALDKLIKLTEEDLSNLTRDKEVNELNNQDYALNAAKVNELVQEIETLNKGISTNNIDLIYSKQEELLSEIDKALEEYDELLILDPTNQEAIEQKLLLDELKMNTYVNIAEMQLTMFIQEDENKTDPLEKISNEVINNLSDKIASLKKSDNPSNISQLIKEEENLISLIEKEIKNLTKSLKSDPSNETDLVQKKLLEELKIKTQIDLAETKLKEYIQNESENLSAIENKEIKNTLVSNTVKELLELKKSGYEANQEEIKAKEKELLTVIEKALEKNEKALLNDPNNKELKNEAAELNRLKETTERNIADLEQITSSNLTDVKIRDTQVTKLISELEALKNSSTESEVILAKEKQLLSAIESAIAKNDKAIKKSPNSEELLAEQRALSVLKATTKDNIAELEQILIAQNELDSQTDLADTKVQDTQVTKLISELEALKNSSTESEVILAKEKQLLSAIESAIAKNDKAIKKSPNSEELLAEQRALSVLKATTKDNIAELEQILIAQNELDSQTDIADTKVQDTQVTKLISELEALKSSSTESKVILTKEKQLLNAIESAIAKNDKALKKSPDSEELLAEQRALSVLKATTKDNIAELEQILIAQNELDSQTDIADTKVQDAQVTKLISELEALKSSSTESEVILAKEKQLLNAIESAIAKNDKALKKSPDNEELLAEQRALNTLKTATQDDIAELEQILIAQNNTTSSPSEIIVRLRQENDADILFENSKNKDAEELNLTREALKVYSKKIDKKLTEIDTEEERIELQKEKQLIQDQIDLIDRVLAEMEFVYTVEKGIIKSNDSEVIELQNEVMENRNEIVNLTQKLENADKKEQRNIEKELNIIEKENALLEQKLVVAQKEELANTTESFKNNIESSKLNENSEITSNQTLIESKLQETLSSIDELENAKKKERELISQKTLTNRDELVEALVEQEVRIESAKLTQEVLASTQLKSEDVFGIDEQEYTLTKLRSEMGRIELELKHLNAEKGNANSKRRPIIEIEIANMTSEFDSLKEQAEVLENNLAQKRITETKEKTILSEASTSTDTYKLLEEKEVIRMAQKQGYNELSNEINELQLLERRLINLEIEQANTRNEIAGRIKRAAVTYDDNEKQKLLEESKTLANNLEQLTNEITSIKQDIVSTNKRIEENPLFVNEDKNALISMALEGVQPIRIRPIENVFVGLKYNSGESTYTPENPIPMNQKMPDGLVYKVQVGAFNRPVPEETFKEFNPVSAEQINNGIIRYTVGLFNDKGTAYSAQNRVRSLGYRDAFVVAYCNGRRMTVSEADQLIRSGQCVPQGTSQEVLAVDGGTSTSPTTSPSEMSVLKPKSTYNEAPNAAPAIAVEDMKGLFFTVQVGVYNYPIPASRLYNIEPLNTNLSDKGQIRYSTGRFDDVNAAVVRRDEIRRIGITDAFVTAYYDGQRISVAEGRKLLEEKSSSILYNNIQQNEPITYDNEGEAGLVIVSKEDTRKKLNQEGLQKIGVSSEQYEHYPSKELTALRKSGVWAYYHEESKRIRTNPVAADESLVVKSDFVEIGSKTLYQGFEIDLTKGLYFESLQDVSLSKSYYAVEISWSGDLSQLTAAFLSQSGIAILNWDVENKTIEFGPLDYQTKEELKKQLKYISNIEVEERTLVWE